jgi:hypothetical protein
MEDIHHNSMQQQQQQWNPLPSPHSLPPEERGHISRWWNPSINPALIPRKQSQETNNGSSSFVGEHGNLRYTPGNIF